MRDENTCTTRNYKMDSTTVCVTTTHKQTHNELVALVLLAGHIGHVGQADRGARLFGTTSARWQHPEHHAATDGGGEPDSATFGHRPVAVIVLDILS